MKHIKKPLSRLVEEISKKQTANRKFYHANAPIFLKYFDSQQQYQRLMDSGDFEKIKNIIREKSDFNVGDFNTNNLI